MILIPNDAPAEGFWIEHVTFRFCRSHHHVNNYLIYNSENIKPEINKWIAGEVENGNRNTFRAEPELENMKAFAFFNGKTHQAACLEYVTDSQIVAGVVFILINHYLHHHNHASFQNFILGQLNTISIEPCRALSLFVIGLSPEELKCQRCHVGPKASHRYRRAGRLGYSAIPLIKASLFL